MIAIVFILCILVVALIVRDIIMQIKFNDLKGSHNVLTGKVKDCEALIDAQRLPDKDKTAMISAILDLRYPRKYPDGHAFKDKEGQAGVIVGSSVEYAIGDPFNKKLVVRLYKYIRPSVFEPWPWHKERTVSESFLESMDKAKAEALAECQVKKEPACKRKPACKKKGGKKS